MHGRASKAGRSSGTRSRSGRVDALEVDLHTYDGNHYSSVAPYLTVNVALWPRTTTLIANEAALGKLSDQQSRWIRQAAARRRRLLADHISARIGAWLRSTAGTVG